MASLTPADPSPTPPRGPDAGAVNSMFAGIARRYDLANHVLSGGLDFLWRRQLVREVARRKPRHAVDLATGSGDVAFALRRALPPECAVTGLDFCPPMLEQAEEKKGRDPRLAGIRFAVGDCLALPLPDNAADAVTIAFGLRNLADRDRGLREMRRILAPGGRLFILEFSQATGWFRPLYRAYLRGVLPVLARSLTGHRAAYEYLGSSIEAFPDREGLSAELAAAGLEPESAVPLTGGAVALHVARKG